MSAGAGEFSDDRPRSAVSPTSAGAAPATAERVAEIVAAAEASAKRMLEQTEERVRDRIAEADRAAENRIVAAEAEAQEIIAHAQGEAEKAIGDATSEALAIVARAQDNAASVLSEAQSEAAAATAQAEERAHEFLRHARGTASDVNSEGLEIVANLREMGDAMRSNAQRLMRDIQQIHSQLVARLDRIDGGASGAEPDSVARRGRRRDLEPRGRSTAAAVGDDGDALDVPEFIPPE